MPDRGVQPTGAFQGASHAARAGCCFLCGLGLDGAVRAGCRWLHVDTNPQQRAAAAAHCQFCGYAADS
eukprot:9407737-Lingulodinium_polyedra.AAC.1